LFSPPLLFDTPAQGHPSEFLDETYFAKTIEGILRATVWWKMETL